MYVFSYFVDWFLIPPELLDIPLRQTGAPTAAAAPEDAEEGGSAEETAAASAQWIPNYRGDGNPEVNSPTVSVPLRIHAKAWQEPWKRVKRPVRATEAELAANDAVLAQE